VRGLLIVNPRSGDDSPTPKELAREARARGVEVRVLEPGDDPAEAARDADGPLGIAGGDGSLAPVAAVALERGLPFVCVPFGTRNHFARDAGLDRDDPLGALAAFDGRERRIDVGRVGGERLFLNNVSLGLYARLVHRREHHRRRRDALARLRALTILARHREPLGITVDGEPLRTRVLFVGNNAYALELLSIGQRERLDEGLLHLYVPEGLLPSAWHDRAGERFRIDARAGRLEAAIDGEPEELATPVELSIEPRALRLLVPPGA
jgi:diacylglycerol kinase family enzyme